VVLLAGHWPALVDETTHNEPFHFLMHLILFLTALAFWMPVINTLPEFSRLSRAGTLLYLFVTSIPATLPTMMLIFATHPLYPAYAGGPQYLGWGFKTDQEIAGAIMGTVVTLEIWLLAAYQFFAWWAEEQREEEQAASSPAQPPVASLSAQEAGAALPDGLTWADVEPQLARVPPPRP